MRYNRILTWKSREGCRAGNGRIVSVADCLLIFGSSMRYLSIFIDIIYVDGESSHLPRSVAGRWAAAPFIGSPPRTPEAYLTEEQATADLVD